ncbi:hypothetical protein FUSO4_08490 [Fusobacterium necrophorum DJ-1]|uniref:Uncharacterized protein n=1 Tax=Fusobacterium necrophorum DJ-2 TaxID=1441737 RepID=A0AB73C4C7_9FUSO|nr:hypothetical protein FUSO4_08490 [Fusobacterium necrophorum DJ-1]KDE72863.1 hypothetical protein FUSO8_03565 [Fusobacterium necrophorum DJ-2]MBR8824074.1 hypothetical protein [Fusobacterium necrophorum]
MWNYIKAELIYSTENKFLRFKIYASKSKYPLGVHGGFVYGSKVINKKVMTIEEYRNKVHFGSDRNIWR